MYIFDIQNEVTERTNTSLLTAKSCVYIYGKCLTTERLNLPFNPAREVDIFTQNNTLKCGWKHIQSTFFIQQQNFLSLSYKILYLLIYCQ